MTFQNSLFDLDVMQDRSGRLKDYPAPPAKYGDCAPRRHLRALPPDDPEAERCQCFSCPYNLTGEIGRIKSEAVAVRAMEIRYNAEEWDTCLLDILGPPDEFGQSEVIDDTRAGDLLGLSHERVAQVVANAAFKFRKAYALEAQSLEMTEAARAAERVKLRQAPTPEEHHLEAVAALERHGTRKKAAEALGVTVEALRYRLTRSKQAAQPATP